MKCCKHCQEAKPPESFHKWNRSKDGLADWCKACKSDYQKANRTNEKARFQRWYTNPANRERTRMVNAAWREANYERHLQHRRTYNARRRARESSSVHFTIEEWLDRLEEFGGRCAYCLQSAVMPEPDHMTPVSRGGGNGIANIVPACRQCNSSKGARTLLEYATPLWPKG